MMAIKQFTCVTVTCDRCGADGGADGEDEGGVHYATEASARRALTEGRFVNPSYNTELWRWDENGQVCSDCLRTEVEDACDHVWQHDRDVDNPALEYIVWWMSCSKCTAHRMDKVPRLTSDLP